MTSSILSIPDNLPISWLERQYELSSDALILVSNPNSSMQTGYISKYIKAGDLCSDILAGADIDRLKALVARNSADISAIYERISGAGLESWICCDIENPYIISAIHENLGSIDEVRGYRLSSAMEQLFNDRVFSRVHFTSISVDTPIVGPIISGEYGQIPYLTPNGISSHEPLFEKYVCSSDADVIACKADSTVSEIIMVGDTTENPAGIYIKNGSVWIKQIDEPGQYLMPGVFYKNPVTKNVFYLNSDREFTVISQPPSNYVLSAATSSTLGGIKIWTGTLTEYDMIESKDSDTLYLVHGE